MNRVKIEAFLSTSNDANDVRLFGLLEEIRHDYDDKVEIVIHKGRVEQFNDYCLTATPAVVIEEMIKIVGFCPSKETLVSALKEYAFE